MLRILYHIFQVRKQREGRRTESAIFLERSVDPLCSSPFLPLTIYQVKASWDTNILLTKFGFKVPVLTQLLTALDRKTQSAPILLVHLTMILQSEPFFRFSVNKAAQKQAWNLPNFLLSSHSYSPLLLSNSHDGPYFGQLMNSCWILVLGSWAFLVFYIQKKTPIYFILFLYQREVNWSESDYYDKRRQESVMTRKESVMTERVFWWTGKSKMMGTCWRKDRVDR